MIEIKDISKKYVSVKRKLRLFQKDFEKNGNDDEESSGKRLQYSLYAPWHEEHGLFDVPNMPDINVKDTINTKLNKTDITGRRWLIVGTFL